jgi:hypothetical protein
MKKRKLLTDIFTVVLMAAILVVILAYLNVFPGEYSKKGTMCHTMLVYVGMPLALISVLLIDMIFPIIDNRAKLSTPKYLIKVIIKALLFAAAIVVGILFFVVDSFSNMNDFLKVGIFCALYFAQFLINLDPPLKKKVVDNKDKEDEYEDFSDDLDDFDDEDDK